MKNKQEIKANTTLIKSKFDNEIYYDSIHINIPVGASYENAIFEYETNKNFDNIIGFGLAATYKYVANINLTHTYLTITDETYTLFEKTNIRAWMQDQTYLNKDLFFRPVFSLAGGKKIKFILDATHPGGSLTDSDLNIIIFYKNKVNPYPFEINFHTSQIHIPYSYTIGASYNNPIIHQFNLTNLPNSYSEIIGFNLVAGSKFATDIELDLLNCDIALICDNKYLMDFLPILYFRTYNYSKSNERNMVYMYKDLNQSFFPIYRNEMQSKKITLLIKFYEPINTISLDLYQDAIFLIRRKTQRYL